MIDHVTIRVADRAASERFFTTVLPTLGIEPTGRDATFVEWNDFSIAAADDEHPLTRNLHVAFVAPTVEHITAFWRAGVDAGYEDDGAPGARPQYTPDYVGAFLRDPDGNSVEAVRHGRSGPPGNIDHLWLRTRDIAAAKRFFLAIMPHAGITLAHDEADRVGFRHAGGSFSFVVGTPTEHVHLAFAAVDRAAVDAFHAAALDAGARDNGAPGERPAYHEGYYGAYVLDPDGHNVEAVHHGRRPR